MRKKEILKEENYYKELNKLMDNLDSYEEFYPGIEIEENRQMKDDDLKRLKEIADYFPDTDIHKYIMILIDTENDIKEYFMLDEEDISKALYLRDMLYLISISKVRYYEDINKELMWSYFNERKESLKSALTQNARAAALAETNKVKTQTIRNSEKINIYLNVVQDIIDRMEGYDNG